MTDQALAYVYRGTWVAECPTYCGNVQKVFRENSSLYRCVHCEQLASVKWPDSGFMEMMTAVLDRRPDPDNRNWYPEDHPVAVRFGIPHGQSVQDLLDENAEHGIN